MNQTIVSRATAIQRFFQHFGQTYVSAKASGHSHIVWQPNARSRLMAATSL